MVDSPTAFQKKHRRCPSAECRKFSKFSCGSSGNRGTQNNPATDWIYENGRSFFRLVFRITEPRRGRHSKFHRCDCGQCRFWRNQGTTPAPVGGGPKSGQGTALCGRGDHGLEFHQAATLLAAYRQFSGAPCACANSCSAVARNVSDRSQNKG